MENKTEVVLQKPGFWRLFGAYFIDFIITFFVAWVLWKLLWVFVPNRIMGVDEHLGVFILVGICTVCICIPNILYFAGCESWRKQTLGKRLLGIRIFGETQQNIQKKLLAAYGLDFLLLIPALTFCLIVGLIIQALVCFDCNPGTFYYCVFWGMTSLYFSAIILYFAMLEHFFGKTLGKKLMGLTVVQAAPQTKKGE